MSPYRHTQMGTVVLAALPLPVGLFVLALVSVCFEPISVFVALFPALCVLLFFTPGPIEP